MENPVMTSPSATRSRIATLVIVGPSHRLEEATEGLDGTDETGAFRMVLISTDPEPRQEFEQQPDVVRIRGIRPEHVNNAIAAVRLSSLPSIVWWRGGPPDGLDGAATLADRIVLDAEDPWPLWARTPSLFEQTALTDLRWTRLTRWRAALAHFFDLPEVREQADAFSRLTIHGSDRPQCALFAGWLDASLGWNGQVIRELLPGSCPLESVSVGGAAAELSLRLLPNGSCLATSVQMSTRLLASRVVSVGDQHLRSLLSEELRVRSRDLAFERALERALARQNSGT